MEAMQVYHLTIQENGHSRRFVYEDRDEALTRFADAIAAGLDAKLDEVVRGFGTPCRTRSCPFAIEASCSGGLDREEAGRVLTPTERKLVSDLRS
jgi:hypothetical protein